MSKQAKKKPAPKKGAKATAQSPDVRLSQHPRAQRQIRAVRSWGALAGCVLAGYLAWHSGAPFVDSALRAVLWGVIAYVAVWAVAQQVWRHLAVAEINAAEKELLSRLQAERAAGEHAEAPTEIVGGA